MPPSRAIVKKIEPRTQSNNLDGPCIVIEADGEDETDFLPPLDGFACTKEEALARVRDAGIVGMGGAGFPAHVKLAPSKPIEFVIANGAECEPYLTIDERVMIERPGDVVEGVALTMKIVGAPRASSRSRTTRPMSWQDSRRPSPSAAMAWTSSVQLLKTKYPQGGEKMLITALTGKEVPSGGLPMDVGCVVQNVGHPRRHGRGLPRRQAPHRARADRLGRRLRTAQEPRSCPSAPSCATSSQSGAIAVDEEASGASSSAAR